MSNFFNVGKKFHGIVFSMPWIKNASAGEKIPPADYDKIRKRLKEYADTRPWGISRKIQLRFRGQFCYVANEEADGFLAPLCRLCYMGKNRWSSAFYKYSNERYEPCMLPMGSFSGPLEEAFSVCEVYLI